MLLHLQASILGKAVGSAIASPYLLCRSRQHCGWRGPSLLGLLAKAIFSFALAGKCFKAMASNEETGIPVPERTDTKIMITVQVAKDRTNKASSWAEIVEVERPEVSDNDQARGIYPSHLRSVVNSFDGTMPAERLGALPAGKQSRLFQLNELPNQPCTA